MFRFARTLRFRVAMGFLVLTAAVQTALIMSVPIIRDAYELQQVDAILAEKAGYLGNFLLSQHGPIAESQIQERIRKSLLSDQVFVQVRSSTGQVIASSVNDNETMLPFQLPSDVGWGGDVPRQVNFTFQDVRSGVLQKPTSSGLSRVRVATLRIAHPDEPLMYVQVAMSLQSYDALRSLVRLSLVLAGVTSVAAAAIAGWIIAMFVVSRVERIASAVTKISADQLDERIDLPTGPDEVGQMAVEVNRMLERIAGAFRAQDRFISHVSHELKTPVAALLAQAQVIKRSSASHDYKGFVISVEDEMRRLGKLVESFLLLARFGHGKRFVAETLIPANEVVLGSVQHNRLLAQQHDVRVFPTLYDPGSGEELLVRGDPELLSVAVDNLIRNAIQISPRGSEVFVAVDRENDFARISVRDQGPGIPDEYIDRLFDRWTQVPRSETSRTGSGLGLSIAKGVVDLHGGTISVRNRGTGEDSSTGQTPFVGKRPRGTGAEFTIRLPAARVSLAPAESGVPNLSTRVSQESTGQ